MEVIIDTIEKYNRYTTDSLWRCGIVVLTWKLYGGIPFLHNNLTNLHCEGLQLTSLTSLDSLLPEKLERLYCDYNQLYSLPKLPSNLKYLSCGFNQLSSLPSLPKGLVRLECSNNNLTSLPPLPSSLKELRCGFNRLTSLPPLPASLKELNCFSNYLISLPPLYLNFREIEFGRNPFLFIPEDIRIFRIKRNVNKLPLLRKIQKRIRERYKKRRIANLSFLPLSLDIINIIASY